MVRLSAIDIGSRSPSVFLSSGISAMPSAGRLAATGESMRATFPSTSTSPSVFLSTPNRPSSSSF